jgi:hypothetical protein
MVVELVGVAVVAVASFLAGAKYGKVVSADVKAEVTKLKADVSSVVTRVESAVVADEAKAKADVLAAVARVKAFFAKL